MTAGSCTARAVGRFLFRKYFLERDYADLMRGVLNGYKVDAEQRIDSSPPDPRANECKRPMNTNGQQRWLLSAESGLTEDRIRRAKASSDAGAVRQAT
jgi:hypothetical protein